MSGKPPVVRSAAPTAPPPGPAGGRLPADARIADGLLVRFAADGDRVRATVRGEIDLDVADGLGEVLGRALRASRTGLDVDLAAVTFCDSAGLNLLLALRDTAHRTDRTLAVTAAGTRVERLLAITETTDLFTPETAPDPTPGDGRDTTTPDL
ncbi:STAS domain-containing protein [Kitasatospora sp. NPDC093806]|uniref:STAS domain-containing protein n=1 Tax=Kitasatospora sp. NPDC093806 TaxID=3155075 RepID=UPI00341B7369